MADLVAITNSKSGLLTNAATDATLVYNVMLFGRDGAQGHYDPTESNQNSKK